VPISLLDRDRLSDWRGWLPKALEVTLVLALAVQAARLVWEVIVPMGPLWTTGATTDSTAEAVAFPVADVFFRQPATTSTQGHADALGYTLFGVRIDGQRGSAILGKDGDQASYAVGKEVAPGIVLEAVAPEHAVLLAQGARHRLDLPRLAPPPARSGRNAAPPSKAAPPSAAAQRPEASTVADVDPAKLLSEAGLRAHEGGGYTLIRRGDGALLEQAGLQVGDVLLALNGQPLDSERLGDLKNELKDRQQVTLQYRRDGKVHTTTLKAPR
jgi:general secretion pathway protein C